MKRGLVEQILEALRDERALAEERRQEEKRESSQHKGAMASRYDTFLEDSQSRAAGHMRRISELDAAIRAVSVMLSDSRICAAADRVRLGAILDILDLGDDSTKVYFLVSGGGGMTLTVDDMEEKVTSLSIHAPLAQALMSRGVWETIHLEVDNEGRKLQIARIR